MRKFIITILLTSMFLISGCGKDDDDENSLTSPSTNGKGTLSFLLDGIVWRPKTISTFPFQSSHGMEITPIEYDTNSRNKANELLLISIGGNQYDKNHIFIIKIDSVLYEGKYKIKEALFSMGFDQIYNRFDTLSSSNFANITKIHRVYKPAHVDQFNVLYWGGYTEESYVSGTFSVTLKNKNGNGDSVVITDGRFDLKNTSYSDY